MNAARLATHTSLRPMISADIDTVSAIEQSAYGFPWTRGNFIDSIAAGHLAWLLRAPDAVIGYVVALRGAQEMHLLNLTVAPLYQGRGNGRAMLDALVADARAQGDRSLWLEVRESNVRARGIYERYGLRTIGRRRGYYPAGTGRREDAIVMTLDLQGAGDALD
jgi:[ribosomal protein S18]-alanine N-acetyltransferase